MAKQPEAAPPLGIGTVALQPRVPRLIAAGTGVGQTSGEDTGLTSCLCLRNHGRRRGTGRRGAVAAVVGAPPRRFSGLPPPLRPPGRPLQRLQEVRERNHRRRERVKGTVHPINRCSVSSQAPVCGPGLGGRPGPLRPRQGGKRWEARRPEALNRAEVFVGSTGEAGGSLGGSGQPGDRPDPE